ncbi:MAG: hypothetical protein HRU50_15930 [Winogradskyella sp.]|uniref:hypothetical protein n=1 Tax=Winogradskyella sp. TaxID=1883156 RepID=UPI0025D293C2|nr:hypothetical protein [Winogradskyella sp.]NRB61409.1 hypothetical protein [Winogradskyella sp.]
MIINYNPFLSRRFKIFMLFLSLFSFGCSEIVEVSDISNDQIEIIAPTNNSTLTIENVNFSWGSIEDAEQYKLQIVTPSFEEANQVVLDTTIIATGFNKNLGAGDYQWRVRAENSDYQTVFTTQSFSIEE